LGKPGRGSFPEAQELVKILGERETGWKRGKARGKRGTGAKALESRETFKLVLVKEEGFRSHQKTGVKISSDHSWAEAKEEKVELGRRRNPMSGGTKKEVRA